MMQNLCGTGCFIYSRICPRFCSQARWSSTWDGITFAGIENIMLNGLGVVLSPAERPGSLPGLNTGRSTSAGLSFVVIYAIQAATTPLPQCPPPATSPPQSAARCAGWCRRHVVGDPSPHFRRGNGPPELEYPFSIGRHFSIGSVNVPPADPYRNAASGCLRPVSP
jgi:hypothetical protein